MCGGRRHFTFPWRGLWIMEDFLSSFMSMVLMELEAECEMSLVVGSLCFMWGDIQHSCFHYLRHRAASLWGGWVSFYSLCSKTLCPLCSLYHEQQLMHTISDGGVSTIITTEAQQQLQPDAQKWTNKASHFWWSSFHMTRDSGLEILNDLLCSHSVILQDKVWFTHTAPQGHVQRSPVHRDTTQPNYENIFIHLTGSQILDHRLQRLTSGGGFWFNMKIYFITHQQIFNIQLFGSNELKWCFSLWDF